MALYKRKVSNHSISIRDDHREVDLDGTTVRYFSCNDNYGLYVRPAQIESVLNESQINLSRSASTQSVKSHNSSTGSLSAPSTAKSSGLPNKQPTLRAPSASRSSRPASGTRLVVRDSCFIRRHGRKQSYLSPVFSHWLGIDDDIDQTGSRRVRSFSLCAWHSLLSLSEQWSVVLTLFESKGDERLSHWIQWRTFIDRNEFFGSLENDCLSIFD